MDDGGIQHYQQYQQQEEQEYLLTQPKQGHDYVGNIREVKSTIQSKQDKLESGRNK